jgi:hypothetical protein
MKMPRLDRTPPPSPLSPGSLVVLAGGQSTTHTVAPGQYVVLGRDPGSGIVLDDPSVGLSAVQIVRLGPGWLVTSLDAQNPALILDATGRAHPIDKELGLRSGELLVGGCQIRLYPPAP